MRTDFDRRLEEAKKELATAYAGYALHKRRLEHYEMWIKQTEPLVAELERSRQDWNSQNAVDDAARMEAAKQAAEAQEAKEKRQPKRRKGK